MYFQEPFQEPIEYLFNFKKETKARYQDFSGNGISKSKVSSIFNEKKVRCNDVTKLISNINKFLEINNLDKNLFDENEVLYSKYNKVNLKLDEIYSDNINNNNIKEIEELLMNYSAYVDPNKKLKINKQLYNFYKANNNLSCSKKFLDNIVHGAISVNIDKLEVMNDLTVDYLRIYEYDDVIKIFNLLKENNAEDKLNDKFKKSLFNTAIAFNNSYRYIEALEILNKLEEKYILSDSQQVEVLINKGRALMMTNENKKAINIYKKILDTSSNLDYKKLALMNLGKIFMTSDVKKSKSYLNEAFKINADKDIYNDDNNLLLIELYLILNDSKKIMKHLRSIKVKKDNKFLYNLLDKIQEHMCKNNECEYILEISNMFSFDLNRIRESLSYIIKNNSSEALKIIGN